MSKWAGIGVRIAGYGLYLDIDAKTGFVTHRQSLVKQANPVGALVSGYRTDQHAIGVVGVMGHHHLPVGAEMGVEFDPVRPQHPGEPECFQGILGCSR